MTAVGLELSGNAVKIAVLDGVKGKVKLKAFETRKLDPKKGDTEDIVSVVTDLLKQTKAPKNQVVIAIRAQDCMIREVVVPFTDEDKIRKTIKYQAENYFTSLSIDDLIIEYATISKTEEKSKLLVAGIKKAHVARRLELLGECGVDPLSVDLDVAALYNAYAHLGAFDGVEGALLVDITADTLKVGVIEGGKLRLARAIRMRLGSMRLDQARQPQNRQLSAESGVYDTQADDSARLPVVILDEGDDEAFSLEDSGITEVEREGILHRLFMEIDRTVAGVQLQHEIERICLTGASCRLEGIEQVFSDHFEIDAVRFDLSEALGLGADLAKGKKDAKLSLQGGTAVGLALKGLGIDHAGMDFRQEEFAYAGTFAQLKRGLACVLTLLFALTFLYAFSLKQELREKKGTHTAVKAMQRNLYTVLFPNLKSLDPPHEPLSPPGSDAFAPALKAKKAKLESVYAGGPIGNQTSVPCLEILQQFAEAKAGVPRQYQIQVLQVRLDPKPSAQSRFFCHTTDQAGPIELTKRFEKSTNLAGVNRETRPDPKRGGYLFEFMVKVKQAGPPGRR